MFFLSLHEGNSAEKENLKQQKNGANGCKNVNTNEKSKYTHIAGNTRRACNLKNE